MVDIPARPAPSSDRRYFLEFHAYAGGLQIRPLGAEALRPRWAPEPPDKYVGFRDEFKLGAGDLAVEFARFAANGARLTWLGVYGRSVDERYGDRGNHAGVGIWLSELQISGPRLMLDGLRQLAEVVARSGAAAAAADADQFASRWIPQFVAELPPAPPELSGWAFSATPFCETAPFVADSATEGVWDQVADHVAMWSLLSSPSPETSRALVLVTADRATALAQRRDAASLGPVPVGEVLGALPAAASKLAKARLELETRLQGTNAKLTDASGLLEQERAKTARLQQRIEELDRQVADSDLLRRLAAIDKQLTEIKSRTATVDDVSRLAASIRAASPRPEHTAYVPARSGVAALLESTDTVYEPPSLWVRYRLDIVLGIIAVILLIVAGLVFLAPKDWLPWA